MAKVTVTIPDDLLAEARYYAGPRQLSGYLSDALQWRIEREHQRERIQEWLDEMEEEHGPVPEDLMEEARRTMWPGAEIVDPPKRRRSA